MLLGYKNTMIRFYKEKRVILLNEVTILKSFKVKQMKKEVLIWYEMQKVDSNQSEIVKALRNAGAWVTITSQLKNAFDIFGQGIKESYL